MLGDVALQLFDLYLHLFIGRFQRHHLPEFCKNLHEFIHHHQFIFIAHVLHFPFVFFILKRLSPLFLGTLRLAVQYVLSGLVAGRNPFRLMWNMFPAYLTGWGCCSSAATLPVTLRQTRRNGVSDKITDLVIPLCANVHLAGSMANMVVYTAGFIVLGGGVLSLGQYVEFMFLLSVIAVASPGIPGGVVLASATIAESALGFSPERYALVIATYMTLDGMGTACNLTGDGAIAVVMDRFFGNGRKAGKRNGRSDEI